MDEDAQKQAKAMTRKQTKGTIGRRRFMQGAGLLSLGGAVAMACGGAKRQLLTTLDGTIGLGGEGVLVRRPGEPYEVRTELAQAQVRRELRRRPLAVFHHFSDFRVVDEESPLRSEWVESCDPPLATGAFRPQESLSLQAAAAMVAQANRIERSPVTNRRWTSHCTPATRWTMPSSTSCVGSLT